MNQEELKPIIDAIISEVMKKIQYPLEGQTKTKENLFLVFTGGTESLDTVLSSLKALKAQYNFLALFTPAAEKAFGKERVRQEIEFEEVSEDDLYHSLAKTDTIIFPTLTQNTAAKAVVGIRDSLASEALACGLLLNKHVVAVSDSIPIRSMPAAYARMVGEILKRLEQLGVDLCKADELLNKVPTSSKALVQNGYVQTKPVEQPEAVEKDSSQKAFVLEDGLLTAETIYQAAIEGYDSIHLPSKVIVTPMAKDIAKEKNISLEWAVN